MGRKKPVRLTKKVKEFICEKMAEGLDVSSICKKYSDQVPDRATIYRESVKDPDFRDDLNQSYTILLMHRLDELHEVSDEDWVKDRLDHYGGDYKLAFEARRARLDELKFMLGKIAPILSKRFDKTDKVEIKGEGLAPQIQILNYNSDIEAKLEFEDSIDNLIENHKKTIDTSDKGGD